MLEACLDGGWGDASGHLIDFLVCSECFLWSIDIRGFGKIIHNHDYFLEQSMGDKVKFPEWPTWQQFQAWGSYIICCNDESFEIYIKLVASAHRTSFDPVKTKRRLPIRIWAVSFVFSTMSTQEGLEKIWKQYLEELQPDIEANWKTWEFDKDWQNVWDSRSQSDLDVGKITT